MGRTAVKRGHSEATAWAGAPIGRSYHRYHVTTTASSLSSGSLCVGAFLLFPLFWISAAEMGGTMEPVDKAMGTWVVSFTGNMSSLTSSCYVQRG